MKANYDEEVKAGAISKEDGALATEFQNKYHTAKQNSEANTKKYFYILQWCLKELHKRNLTLATLDEDSILALFKHVSQCELSEESRFNYWKTFVRFYKWTARRYGQDWSKEVKTLLYDGDKGEVLVYKINKNNIKEKPTFNEEQAIEIMNADKDLCWKVYWGVLADSGARKSELASIRVGDVSRIKSGEGLVQIYLKMQKSKTRKRPITLEQGLSVSISLVEKWMQVHPKRADLQAPFFCNSLGELIKGSAANKRLKLLIAQIASIEQDPEKKKAWSGLKEASIHSFRHTKATIYANRGVPEHAINELMGWAAGSKMASHYIKQAQLDVQAALRRAYGKAQPEEIKLKGKTCLNCQHQNTGDSERCELCHLPLDHKALEILMKGAFNVQSLEQTLDSLHEDNPNVQKLLNLLLKMLNDQRQVSPYRQGEVGLT